jgi:hypothetical protein
MGDSAVTVAGRTKQFVPHNISLTFSLIISYAKWVSKREKKAIKW